MFSNSCDEDDLLKVYFEVLEVKLCLIRYGDKFPINYAHLFSTRVYK